MGLESASRGMMCVAVCLAGGVTARAGGAQGLCSDAETAEVSVGAALESAVAHLSMGWPRVALEDLAVVKRGEPDNPWLAYLRGQAFLSLGHPTAALAELDRAEAMVANEVVGDSALTRAILAQRSLARRKRLHIELRFGFLYDTNVTFLDEAAASPGLIAGEQDTRYAPRLALDYAFLDDGTTYVSLGGSAEHTSHARVESFDFTEYEGHIAIGRRFSNRLEAELRLAYDSSRLGGGGFSSVGRMGVQWSYYWDERTWPISMIRPVASHLLYQLEIRDFRFSTTREFDRDGVAQFVGLEQTLQVQPLSRIDWMWGVRLGYRFGHVATKGSEFDRRAHRFGAGLTIPLIHPTRPGAYLLFPDKPLHIRLDAGWQWDRYRRAGLTDADGDRRHDLISGYTLVLSQTLIDDPARGTLVLHGVVDYSEARSNVRLRDHTSPFSYEKTVYGVQLQWSW